MAMMRTKIFRTQLLLAPPIRPASLLPSHGHYCRHRGLQTQSQPRLQPQRRFSQGTGPPSTSASSQSTDDSKLDSIIESLKRINENQRQMRRDISFLVRDPEDIALVAMGAYAVGWVLGFMTR